MLRWALRFFLFRVLPRRLLWFMTIADLYFLLRSIRRRIGGTTPVPVTVNDPRRSRTATPPPRPRVGRSAPTV
jgi:hypothetical protein